MSHIDNVEKTFRQAGAFRDQGKVDQAAHFEAKGYDSLKQLSERVEKYSDEQANPALKSELLFFIHYMIEHKTIKLQKV